MLIALAEFFKRRKGLHAYGKPVWNFLMKICHIALAVLATVTGLDALFSNAAQADVIFNAPAGLAGNQNYPGTLGLNFRVNAGSTLNVTALGVFNPLSATDTAIQTNLYVQLFQVNIGYGGPNSGAPISAVAVTPALDFLGVADPTGAAYVFQSIAPITLGAGDYEIAAWDYNAIDKAYNQTLVASNISDPITFDNLGGALTFLGSSWSPTIGTLATLQAGPGTLFGAGSFQATDPPVPVPEASSLSLLGAGLLAFAGISGFRRRKRPSLNKTA